MFVILPANSLLIKATVVYKQNNKIDFEPNDSYKFHLSDNNNSKYKKEFVPNKTKLFNSQTNLQKKRNTNLN